MRKQLQKGFTLIELVIVMVIIGVLAAAAGAGYVDLKGEAVKTNNAAAGKAVKSAWNMQYGKNGGVEPTLSQLAAATEAPNQAGGIATVGGGKGVCVDTDYIVLTYTDSARTTPTIAATDVVKSTAIKATLDATSC